MNESSLRVGAGGAGLVFQREGVSQDRSFSVYLDQLVRMGIDCSDEDLARYLFRSAGPYRLKPYASFVAGDDIPGDLKSIRVVGDLFQLERDMRPVMLHAIDVIESQLKSQCVRVLCSELGSACLADPANFRHLKEHRRTCAAIAREVACMRGADACRAPGGIGAIPVPEAIEAASLSVVLRLLCNVRSADVANEVAASFSANRRCLVSWLKALNLARNSFAHSGPYFVGKRIPTVPKPIRGVGGDAASPMYVLHVVERLLQGRADVGGEHDERDLLRYRQEASVVLGRFAWKYPELAVRLGMPYPFVGRYADERLPKVDFARGARRSEWSFCRLAA